MADIGNLDEVAPIMRIPIAAASLLLAAAAALFVAAEAAPSSLAESLLFMVAVGFGGVAALVMAVAIGLTLQARRGLDASPLGDLVAAGDPMALTDADLEVIAVNAAIESRIGVGVSAGLGEILSHWDGDIDARIYRLTRAAARSGMGVERLDALDPMLLRVRRVAEGRLLWSVEPAPAIPPLNAEFAPFAHARMRLDGEFREKNEAFEVFSDIERGVIRDAVRQSIAQGDAYATVDLASRKRNSIAIHRRQDADVALFVYPEWSALSHGREAVFDQMPVALARLTHEGRIMSINAAARLLLGDAAEVGLMFQDIVEGFGRPLSARIHDTAVGEATPRSELARGFSGDKEIFIQVSLAKLDFDGGASVLAVLSDATELKTLEQQFVQSQKMQAVGQLAGGVAHDFNNLLTAILGHCDLLMMRKAQTSPEFADLSQIRQNANRAAALVRQLLAFSRKQTMRPASVDISDSLGELLHLLNRLLGERVEIRLACDSDLWPVWIDPQQFEQVVMNLVVNARDAMEEGGVVEIRSHNQSYTTEFTRDRASVTAGDYVVVEVQDTGIGIRDDLLDKIFEPFYTTKRLGEGTGLGLSTVYGIVKQTGGFIFVDSKAGEGTTFTIMLPRLVAAPEAEKPAQAPDESGDLTGTGRILLVEDEAPVRAFASRALKLRGYAVLEADSAEAALEILSDPDLEVDLMISDVVMPGLDGPSWVRKARETRPDVAVVFISGYAEDVFRKGMDGVENFHFLPKPFSLEDLAAMAKKAMAGAPEEAAA